MKFVCDRCQTKYSIADERVRGKILKVKCKSCANVITVREARRPSAGYSTVSATGHDSERTVLAPNPGMMAEAMFAATASAAPLPVPAPAPAPARQTGAHAIPTAPDDGLAWYMALAGERSGPFSRKQLVDKVFVLPKNADLHVWNEKLGEWKPPADVPAVAADLAARRKAPPPLPPGAPRRATPSPPPPPVGAHADRPARPSGAMAAVGSPLHPGGGMKLPPPSGGGQGRPLSALAASASSTAPARAQEAGFDLDPTSMLETPAPQAHMLHGHGGTNGVGHKRATGTQASTSATRSSSDVLKLLNLPGAAESTPGAPPRLISASETVGWSPSVAGTAARGRSAKLFVALLGVVGVICVVGVLGLSNKKHDPAPVAPPKAAVTDPLAGVVDKMNLPPPPAPPPVVAPVPDPPAPLPAPMGRGKPGKGRLAKGRGTAPVTVAAAAVDNSAANARYKDTGPGIKVSPTGANPNRPPPSQTEISAVINNNRGGIKNCYQRALLRDNSLTHGKITVKLTLGISGRVKHAAIDGPQQFRAVEPCIKELVSRWVFPQASDEYGTEFVYVFQGNE